MRFATPLGILLVVALPSCGVPAREHLSRPPPATSEAPLDRVFYLSLPVAPSEEETGRGGTLVPLYCLVGGEPAGAGACLRQGPAVGETVALEDGRQATVKGVKAASCPAARAQIPALLIDLPAAEFQCAVWPKTARDAVRPTRARPRPAASSGAGDTCRGWCTFGRTGHPRVKVDGKIRRLLRRAVASAGAGPEGLEVVQEIRLDLDGDRRVEHLYSVVVVDRDAAGYAFSFSGLFLLRESDASLMLRGDASAIVVRGTLDLDENGRRELWLLLSPTSGEGYEHMVVSLAEEGTVVLGRHACADDYEPGSSMRP